MVTDDPSAETAQVCNPVSEKRMCVARCSHLPKLKRVLLGITWSKRYPAMVQLVCALCVWFNLGMPVLCFVSPTSSVGLGDGF